MMVFHLKKNLDLLVVCTIVLLLNVSLFLELPVLGAIVIALVVVTGITLALVFYKEALLYALSFCVPLSISVPIGGGSQINAPSEILCAILASYLLYRIIINYKMERSFLKHPVTILIGIDLAWMFITTCLSSMPEVSVKRFVIRVVYILVYYVLFFELFKVNRKNIFKVYMLYCVGMIVPILYTLLRHSYLGFSQLGSAKASLPFYNDHTIYGAAIVFFIPFLFYYSFYGKQKLIFKVMAILLLVLFAIAAFYSYSRAAWLSLFISVLVYAVISIHPKKIYVLIFIAALGIGGYILKDSISNMLSNSKEVSLKNDVSMHIKSAINVKTDVSNTERLNRWKCAWRMFLDKPWLGFGPGTYQFFYGAYQVSNDITVISTFAGNRGHAHSEFLNYLCEEGLLGFLIFTMLVVMVCYRSVKLIYQTKEKETQHIATLIFLGLVTFFVHSFFNGFIETDKMAMPVFVSMAALVSLDMADKSKYEQQK